MDQSKFLEHIKENNPNANLNLIAKALKLSFKLHQDQKRKDGSPYITHPLEVALILSNLRADSATICAAILHDTVEDGGVSPSAIKKDFGKEISDLVKGVTKQNKLYYENFDDYHSENLRKILLATTKDIRVMLVKLADRLHNMRTLNPMSSEQQRRISQQTLQIYAPIAEKLGLFEIKGELEDLSLRYLKPKVYNNIKDKIVEKREEREKKTKNIIKKVSKILEKQGMTCRIMGRAKYFYSIYKKMKVEKKSFDEIHDLIGIRIITLSVDDCYKVLEILHKELRPKKGHFKDYIKNPKENGYQSIHTTVYGPYNKLLEVQIRTLDMHYEAESGMAAHWQYKGTERDKLFDKKISWLKEMLAWLRDSRHSSDIIETLKIDLFENEIVVFTPKGDPISLKENATTIDFAYEVHSEVGNKAKGARVNGKSVPLNTKLQSGDVVEIVTSAKAAPARNWLNFVITSKAKNRIRSHLNIGFIHKSKYYRKRTEKSLIDYSDSKLSEQLIVSDEKAAIKLSKCCNPKYGDKIVAFYTKEGKIAIHIDNCPNSKVLDKKKKIRVSWKKLHDENIKEMHVFCKDRIGLIIQLLDKIISFKKIKILSINTKPKGKKLDVRFQLLINNDNEFNELILHLKSIKGVLDIAY